MRVLADQRGLVDVERIRFHQPQSLAELPLQLLERGDASPVALDRDDFGSGVEQGPGEAAGPGTDFIDSPALERTRDRRDPRQQLAIEDEILPQRLARAE